MAVKRTTPQSAIDREIEESIKRFENAVVYALSYVGERAVKHARELPSLKASDFDKKTIPPHKPFYMDWDGNLRSSIGYVVVKKGSIVDSGGFEAKDDRGKEGARMGRDYAEMLATQARGWFALIVVAGMSYASYVTNKGYNVIDSAELLADRLVPELMKDLTKVKDIIRSWKKQEAK